MQLEELNVASNKLSSIPDIAGLVKLKRIAFFWNKVQPKAATHRVASRPSAVHAIEPRRPPNACAAHRRFGSRA
jgi:hypothetical protein